MTVLRVVQITFDRPFANSAERSIAAVAAVHVSPQLPGVTSVEVGIGADEVDLAILIRFDTAEAAVSYGSHPLHQEFVDEFLRRRMGTTGRMKTHNYVLA